MATAEKLLCNNEPLLKSLRERTNKILSQIAREVPDENENNNDCQDNEKKSHGPTTTTTTITTTTTKTKTYESWIRGSIDNIDFQPKSSRTRYFDRNGFILVKGFVDETEISEMKSQMISLVENDWHPGEKTSVFRTDDKQVAAQGSDDYFLDSASKAHFFSEQDATIRNGSLKEEFQNNKMGALNKAGHGLHMIQGGAFHKYTTSKKVQSLVQELGWVDPIVPQSMYIFKQPRVGGLVTSHQDSTFLYTTPRQTCLGLWLALDDATLENGCLWVRPGSHREPVRRRFTRNPEYFINGDTSKPLMIVENLDDIQDGKEEQEQQQCDEDKRRVHIEWEGKLPSGSDPPCDGLFNVGFIPMECRAGDLVAFPGELDHLSLPNYSDLQRHTFQLHLVEGPNAGVTWSKTNWLQYPPNKQFMSIAI